MGLKLSCDIATVNSGSRLTLLIKNQILDSFEFYRFDQLSNFRKRHHANIITYPNENVVTGWREAAFVLTASIEPGHTAICSSKVLILNAENITYHPHNIHAKP